MCRGDGDECGDDGGDDDDGDDEDGCGGAVRNVCAIEMHRKTPHNTKRQNKHNSTAIHRNLALVAAATRRQRPTIKHGEKTIAR